MKDKIANPSNVYFGNNHFSEKKKKTYGVI